MERQPRVSADCLAGDDEGDLVADFGYSERTLAEQRVSGAGQSGGGPAVGRQRSGQGEGRFGLGSLASATASATGKLLGQATAAVSGGGATSSGGRTSVTSASEPSGQGLGGRLARLGSGLGQAASQVQENVRSSQVGRTSTTGSKADEPSAGVGMESLAVPCTCGHVLAPDAAFCSKCGAKRPGTGTPKAGSTLAGVASGVSAVAGVAAVAGASLLSGTAAAVGGAAAALGLGAGAGEGEPASEVALGLANGLVELMAAGGGALDAEAPQAELAGHIDAVVACRSLNDFGARLLDFWYALRPDALSPWANHLQNTWVRLAYLAKYGDLRKAPGPLARAAVGLLLELMDGFRSNALMWDHQQGEDWTCSLRYYADVAEAAPPPPGWTFPGLVIVRVAESAFDEPRFSVVRSDMKGTVRVKAAELLASLKVGGRVAPPRPPNVLGGGRVSMTEFRSLTGTFEGLARLAGGTSLTQKCLEKSERLFNQKTRPIQFVNHASTPLKICLFSEDDKFCAVPVGGVGGPCVVTLEPNLRAQLRPPGTAERFQLKVLAPGILERKLYMSYVKRGTSVQLRSHDCTSDN